MGMLSFYNWGLPNKAEHLARYRENDQLYNMARSLWNSLDSASIYFFAAALTLAVLLVCYYYYGYNKLPGRKYKILHWGIWLLVTVVTTIGLTMLLGKVLVSSSLNEQLGFILRISLINGLYASAIYFIASFIICNLPVPTNAYRFLKLGK